MTQYDIGYLVKRQIEYNFKFRIYKHITRVAFRIHLDIVIGLEHIQDLENLPYVYASYFVTPLPTLLNKSTNYLKKWFLVVRLGRKSCAPQSYDNKFATYQRLRNWIGLDHPAT